MLRTLVWAIGVIVGIVTLSVVGYLTWFAFVSRSRRKKEPGFEYVYVDDDGQ